MKSIEVREALQDDMYFVATCTHDNEPEKETVDMSLRRIEWLRNAIDSGLKIFIGLIDGKRSGLLYLLPVEICPFGPLGKDLMVIPCLFIKWDDQKQGLGKSLLKAAVESAKNSGKKGIATIAYYHDMWFMPAPFFEHEGFSLAERKDESAILWKAFVPEAETPKFLERKYKFEFKPGKVVVDLFYNGFCSTCDVEAQRVREVVSEYDDRVILREYCADDLEERLEHGIPRGIFINGKEIFWGYEAPREEIRKAIDKALLET